MTAKTILAATLALMFAPGMGAAQGVAGARIASINLCADQLLMALLPPERVTSLGPYARDPVLSHGAERAKTYAANRGSAETALAGNPDLILVGAFDSAQTRRLIAASGKPVFTLEPWRGFEAGSADIRRLATMIGAGERGEALIREIEAARMKAAGRAKRGTRALVLGRGGYVDISASIVHDLLQVVGYSDVSREIAGLETARSGAFLPLERIVTLKPDILILSETSLKGEDRKARLFAHPAFAKVYPVDDKDGLKGLVTRDNLRLALPTKRLTLPERLTACGGPGLIEALERLTDGL